MPSTQVNIRIEPELLLKAKKAAAKDDRSLSSYIRLAIIDRLNSLTDTNE